MPAKALATVGAIVLALIAIAAAGLYLSARDDATLTPAKGPGVPRVAGAGDEVVVAPGNVVLLYSDERLTRRLRELAAELGGPPDAAVLAAGQAVVVRRRPNLKVAVVALSAGLRHEASGPDDPTLRAFVEYWLGREP